MKKIINAKDYFGTETTYIICFETVVLTETFAVGIDTADTDEVSIFHVVNDGIKDNYITLDTCLLWNVNFNFEDKFKKEIATVLTRVLTNRVKSGMLTVEQIKKWVYPEE